MFKKPNAKYSIDNLKIKVLLNLGPTLQTLEFINKFKNFNFIKPQSSSSFQQNRCKESENHGTWISGPTVKTPKSINQFQKFQLNKNGMFKKLEAKYSIENIKMKILIRTVKTPVS